MRMRDLESSWVKAKRYLTKERERNLSYKKKNGIIAPYGRSSRLHNISPLFSSLVAYRASDINTPAGQTCREWVPHDIY